MQKTGKLKDDSYLPDTIEWYHCRGSKPEFRGYPCSLWTLFHVLTVAQLNQEYSKSNPCKFKFFAQNFESLLLI